MWYFSFSFLINLQKCQQFCVFLSIWGAVCTLMRKKMNLNDFSKWLQYNKGWKFKGVWILSVPTVYIYMLVLLYCTCTGRRVCHSRFPVKPLQAWSSCTSHTPPEDGSQTSGVDRWHSPAAGSVEDRCTHPSQAHTDEYHSYMLENKNKQYQSSINPSFHHVVGRGVTAHVFGLSVQYASNKSFHFFSGKSDNKWHFGATLLIIIFQQQIETV